MTVVPMGARRVWDHLPYPVSNTKDRTGLVRGWLGGLERFFVQLEMKNCFFMFFFTFQSSSGVEFGVVCFVSSAGRSGAPNRSGDGCCDAARSGGVAGSGGSDLANRWRVSVETNRSMQSYDSDSQTFMSNRFPNCHAKPNLLKCQMLWPTISRQKTGLTFRGSISSNPSKSL